MVIFVWEIELKLLFWAWYIKINRQTFWTKMCFQKSYYNTTLNLQLQIIVGQPIKWKRGFKSIYSVERGYLGCSHYCENYWYLFTLNKTILLKTKIRQREKIKLHSYGRLSILVRIRRYITFCLDSVPLRKWYT